MERTSKTLGRIGVALVGAATFLATPSIGVLSASAAPATLDVISPWDGNDGAGNKTISALNDGTNSTIHLEAELNQATAPDPNATSVRFSYCVDVSPADGNCDAAPVIIATDSSSPYSAEWAPPNTIANNSTVHIIYEALSATNVVLNSQTRVFVLDNSKSTVHITSPADGGSIGVWNNNFVAKGTNSADNPTVAVTAFNGAGTVDQNTTAHTWTALVPAPGTTGVHEIEATANGTDSDEEIWATFYAQQVASNGFTVTPGSQSAGLSGGTATSGNYTVTALDQNGNPIADLHILINGNSGTNTITVTQSGAGGQGTCPTQDACAYTDVNGVVKFTDTLTSASTDTITVQTDQDNNGVYNSAVDEQRTVTFTAYNATPTTLTTSATPQQAVYSPNEYNASNIGDVVTVDPQTGNPTGGTGTPYVRTHFVDQNGNPMTNTVINNFNFAVDRTLADGTHGGSIAAQPCTGTNANWVGSCRTNNFGDIYLPKNDNDVQNGSDTFRAWVEVDGIGGETAGDTKAANLTLSWAGEDLQWLNCNRPSGWCNTQAPINTEATFTVHSTVGGQPRNGDTILFDTNGAGILTVTQPAGTIRDDASHAHCVTGQGGAPNGGCSLTVNDSVVESVLVDADDTTTGDNARLFIQFRDHSIAFRIAENVDHAVVRPVDANVDQSTSYGCYQDEINTARPGDVVIGQYQLEDVNGNRLANVDGTATLDHGYFTDLPASYDTYASWYGGNHGSDNIPWEDVTLNGTPAANTRIGSENGQVAPASNGTTTNFSTDNHGIVTFAVSIGRDAGFDDDGNVIVSPTVTVGGQTVKLAPLNDEYDWCDSYNGYADNIGGGHIFNSPQYNANNDPTFSTNAQVWGGGYWNPAGNNALTFTEVNGDSLTGFIPTTQERYVAAWTRDSFGNLTRSGGSAVEVDTNGVGELDYNGSNNPTFVNGSYTDPGWQDVFTIDNDDCINSSPVDQCGTEGHQDVQGTWRVHSVSYQANPGTPPPAFVPNLNEPADNCFDPVAQNCTNPIGPVDIASIDWYVQAINAADGAHYSISHTPAGSIFLVGTTVTETVTALDQHDNPLVGLWVTFYGSGPGQFGCNVSCGSSQTDQNGQASYTYAGSSQGNTQVTGVVTPNNFSNNELARMVDKAGFDGAPTIHAPKHVDHPKKVNVHGDTRAGAHVVLKKKVKGGDWKVVGDKDSEVDGSYSFHKKARAPWTKWKVRVDDLVTSVTKKTNVG